MALLTVQQVTATGTVITFVSAAAGGDTFSNDGKTELEVVNGGASTITLTIVAQNACNQGTLHDGGGTIGAGVTKRFGPFDRQRFNDSSGLVHATYSAVTSVTVAATKT